MDSYQDGADNKGLQQQDSRADATPSKQIVHEDKDTAEAATSDKELRIVLIGKTGTGKSATGNMLLGPRHGRQIFHSDISFGSDTTESTCESSEIDGRKITVVDTPGFCDTKLPPEQLLEKILDCLNDVTPGPNLFLFTINSGRFTAEDNIPVGVAKKLFGIGLLKHSVLVVTRRDEMERHNTDLETLITNEKAPKAVKALYAECSKHAIAVNNHNWEGEAGTQERRNFYSNLQKWKLGNEVYRDDPEGLLKAIEEHHLLSGTRTPNYKDTFWQAKIPKIASDLKEFFGDKIMAGKDLLMNNRYCVLQ